MFPKVEKDKKINEDQDIEQPGLFDKENEKERIAKKRKFVYMAMFLTVGLSLFFWIYRSIKTFNFSFRLPSFNFSVPTPKSNKFILPENTTSWPIFFKKLDSDSVIYQNNQDSIFTDQNLENIINKIDKNNFTTSSIYASSLPEGFKFKELVEENNNNFSYFSKIITPNQQLLLIIKINNSSNLTESKKLIPNLINQLYWYSLQK